MTRDNTKNCRDFKKWKILLISHKELNKKKKKKKKKEKGQQLNINVFNDKNFEFHSINKGRFF